MKINIKRFNQNENDFIKEYEVKNQNLLQSLIEIRNNLDAT